ncbi:MAG TPA: hypothetical protein PK239_06310 [Chitinophagales bacterium]|nr:hypothetical protein [Chitinophagales bacterium]
MGLLNWLFGPVKHEVSTVNHNVNFNATQSLNHLDLIAANQQALLSRTLTEQQKLFIQGFRTVISDASESAENIINNIDKLVSKQRTEFFADIDKIIDKSFDNTKETLDHTTSRFGLMAGRLPGTEKDPFALKFISELVDAHGYFSIKYKGYFPTDKIYTYYLTVNDDKVKETRIVLNPITQTIDEIEFVLPLEMDFDTIEYLTSNQMIRLPIKFSFEKENWFNFVEGLLSKHYLNLVNTNK